MEYLNDFTSTFIDNILIYSKTIKDHIIHINKVLVRLREANLQVDIKKCEFYIARVKYLGYILTTSGIEADLDKLEVLKN